MKNLVNKIRVSRLLVLPTIFAFYLVTAFQNTEWTVPESAKSLKNPVSYSGENPMVAKALYTKHCKSCHGKTGEGDGSKAEELETFPGDFTLEEFQIQTDGSLFYKITSGRDEMPAFDKKLSSEDAWLIVSYLRTLN